MKSHSKDYDSGGGGCEIKFYDGKKSQQITKLYFGTPLPTT